MRAIAKLRINELSDVLSGKGIALQINDEALSYIAEKSFSEKYGARNLARFIQSGIEDTVAEEIIRKRDRSLPIPVSFYE